jgi:regulator of protease activity HflC (stomatin/prohibitin superfamily)
MAELRRYPFIRHLRAEASEHVLYFKRGKLRASGRGLAFWCIPLSPSIAVVPMDQRSQAFAFHGRSSDYQDVTAQGSLTYRIVNPEAVAERFDFTIELRGGTYTRDPLERIASTLSNKAQRHAWDYIASTPLRQILAEGQAQIRQRIEKGLFEDEGLKQQGLAVVSVSVLAVDPVPDVERALESPVREKIQQEVDEATFARRAVVLEKERAIQETELQNRIDLAKRNELLIAQEGLNERRQATEKAEAARISTEAEAMRNRVLGLAQAESIRAVEGTRVSLERERMEVYQDLPPQVLMSLAAQTFAGKIDKVDIDHFNISPDLFASMITTLVGTATKKISPPEGSK